MANIIVNGFSVGTELQSVILLAKDLGTSIPLEQIGHLKELHATQQSTALTISPVLYGGKRLHRNIYHDFSGRLVFDRFNGDITNLNQGIMQRFQNQGYETYFTLYWKVFNSYLNTTDEYMLTQVVLNDHDAGTFSGTTNVENSMAYRSQSLIIQGGAANVLTGGPTASPVAAAR